VPATYHPKRSHHQRSMFLAMLQCMRPTHSGVTNGPWRLKAYPAVQQHQGTLHLRLPDSDWEIPAHRLNHDDLGGRHHLGPDSVDLHLHLCYLHATDLCVFGCTPNRYDGHFSFSATLKIQPSFHIPLPFSVHCGPNQVIIVSSDHDCCQRNPPDL